MVSAHSSLKGSWGDIPQLPPPRSLHSSRGRFGRSCSPLFRTDELWARSRMLWVAGCRPQRQLLTFICGMPTARGRRPISLVDCLSGTTSGRDILLQMKHLCSWLRGILNRESYFHNESKKSNTENCSRKCMRQKGDTIVPLSAISASYGLIWLKCVVEIFFPS